MPSTTTPKKLQGLSVLTPGEAADAGFESITTDINADTEATILASVAQHRDPRRACFITVGGNYYELAILRGDIAR